MGMPVGLLHPVGLEMVVALNDAAFPVLLAHPSGCALEAASDSPHLCTLLQVKAEEHGAPALKAEGPTEPHVQQQTQQHVPQQQDADVEMPDAADTAPSHAGGGAAEGDGALAQADSRPAKKTRQGEFLFYLFVVTQDT